MLTSFLGYSVTVLSLKVPLFLPGIQTSHSCLFGTAAMNTFLLSALCLLGAWAALGAEGVTVQVSSLSLAWPRSLCAFSAMSLPLDSTPPFRGWS